MVWLVSGFLLSLTAAVFWLAVRVGLDCRRVFGKAPICECRIHILGLTLPFDHRLVDVQATIPDCLPRALIGTLHEQWSSLTGRQ
jgi:hypothetical protein